MSDQPRLPSGDTGQWSDPDAFRAEFQRRLAEKGIFVRLPRTDKEWEPPVPFPVSADEASEMVIRMRRGEETARRHFQREGDNEHSTADQ